MAEAAPLAGFSRKGEGLFLEQPVTRDIAVTVWRRLARAGLIPDKRERSAV